MGALRLTFCSWGLLWLTGCALSDGCVAFERIDVATGPAAHQTVVSGHLLGGKVADLAVVSTDEESQLVVYSLHEGEWEKALDVELSSSVEFVDVLRVAGKDRLLLYEAGQLKALDVATQTTDTVASVRCSFVPESPVPHVDVTRDVNGDQRDDLVVPDNDGFWVFVANGLGGFARPVKLGPATDEKRFHAAYGYRHDPWADSRIHSLDFDGDGRQDLAFWHEDHFQVHLQKADGTFAQDPYVFHTEVTFDSDDLASLAAPYGVRRRRRDHNPDGALTGRVLHSLADQNGDGVADLSVFSLHGGSLWKMSSKYEVHYGEVTADGKTRFASEVGASVQARGIPFVVESGDLDDDGRRDVAVATIETGFWKAASMIVGAFFTGTVPLDLDLYRMEDGVFPSSPTATRKILSRPRTRSGERSSVFPAVLHGDVNGDGRSDLLIQNGSKQLRVYLGVERERLFASRPRKVRVRLPNEEFIQLVDLNEDGKQDVLMHYPEKRGSHRVMALIAQ